MILEFTPSRISLQAKLFRGFSDPSRLKILEALGQAPCTVSELVAQTGLSQSNVSNHLACMRDCGLVVAQPSGRYVTYTISDPRVQDLLQLADTLLSDVARGVYECTRLEMPPEAGH
ncbi:MAG: metalloregulator ArsR/SmtB family transcription factor [Anaerolineales bacterium]|nr:metalloregulator ArsR/SmtB family transcription factor [Anaerolineales bacterium]